MTQRITRVTVCAEPGSLFLDRFFFLGGSGSANVTDLFRTGIAQRLRTVPPCEVLTTDNTRSHKCDFKSGSDHSEPAYTRGCTNIEYYTDQALRRTSVCRSFVQVRSIASGIGSRPFGALVAESPQPCPARSPGYLRSRYPHSKDLRSTLRQLFLRQANHFPAPLYSTRHKSL